MVIIVILHEGATNRNKRSGCCKLWSDSINVIEVCETKLVETRSNVCRACALAHF